MARRRQHGPSFGGAWLLAACLCARGSHAEIMRGFGSGSTVPTDADILVKLQALYSEKLKPLEKKSRYHEMGEPALSDAWFDAKPMVLLIGQYSVGKTSFINYLLGRSFAGSRIGPEMTTDRFVAVMYGDTEKTTPGNALTSQPDTPFHSLKKFGTNFLNRFEASALPAPILKRVTLVDSPGVLSGEKQRDRGYDYNGVVRWFAQHSDRILLLFDAYKLDLSDEFKDVMKLIQGYDKKVRVVLNKADGVSPQDLMRVYGALMWNVGGVISAAEVPRVYIGSFWDRPWMHVGMLDLMEAEENDLIEDLVTLPQNNVMNKINEIARRARVVEAHTHLLAYLRSKVVSKWYGKKEEQERLCSPEGLLEAYAQVQRQHDISRGDFPLPSRMASVLRSYDFADFYKPSVERSKKLRALRELTECDIPELITKLHSMQKRRGSKEQIVEGFRPIRRKRPPPPEHLFVQSAPQHEPEPSENRGGVLRAMRRSPFSQPSAHIVAPAASSDERADTGDDAISKDAAPEPAEAVAPPGVMDSHIETSAPRASAEKIAEQMDSQDDPSLLVPPVSSPESSALETVASTGDLSSPEDVAHDARTAQPLVASPQSGPPMWMPSQGAMQAPHAREHPLQTFPESNVQAGLQSRMPMAQSEAQPSSVQHRSSVTMTDSSLGLTPPPQQSGMTAGPNEPSTTMAPSGAAPERDSSSSEGVNVATLANKATGLFDAFKSALSDTKSALASAIVDNDGAAQRAHRDMLPLGRGPPLEQAWTPHASRSPHQQHQQAMDSRYQPLPQQVQHPQQAPRGQQWIPPGQEAQHIHPQRYEPGPSQGWGSASGSVPPSDWQPGRPDLQPPQRQPPPQTQHSQNWHSHEMPQQQQWGQHPPSHLGGWQAPPAQSPSFQQPPRSTWSSGNAISGTAQGHPDIAQTAPVHAARDVRMPGDAPPQFDGRWALDVASGSPTSINQPSSKSPNQAPQPFETAAKHESRPAYVDEVPTERGAALASQARTATSEAQQSTIPRSEVSSETPADAEADVLGHASFQGRPRTPEIGSPADNTDNFASTEDGTTQRPMEGLETVQAAVNGASDSTPSRMKSSDNEADDAAAWAAADAAMLDAARRDEAGTSRGDGGVPPDDWPPSSSS